MKKALFYPDAPVQHRGHSLSKTITYFTMLGYQLTNDINDNWDIGVHWNYADVNKTPKALQEDPRVVLNRVLNNVTKSNVDKVFTEAFGYSSMADTTAFGYCVKKSDRQSAHDGAFIKTPCRKERGWIYQKLIDNRMAPSAIYDIRIPIFNGEIPIIVIKSRTVEGTFENTLSRNKKYWTSSVGSYLSQTEVSQIRRFCKIIGLDIGELDALRDNSTGLLYIVDVNNIPGGAFFDHINDGSNLRNQLAQCLKKQIG